MADLSVTGEKPWETRAIKHGEVFDGGIYSPNYHFMTKEEYLKTHVRPKTPYSAGYSYKVALEDHEIFVEEALKMNMIVPEEVLADYPDLKIGKADKSALSVPDKLLEELALEEMLGEEKAEQFKRLGYDERHVRKLHADSVRIISEENLPMTDIIFLGNGTIKQKGSKSEPDREEKLDGKFSAMEVKATGKRQR